MGKYEYLFSIRADMDEYQTNECKEECQILDSRVREFPESSTYLARALHCHSCLDHMDKAACMFEKLVNMDVAPEELAICISYLAKADDFNHRNRERLSDRIAWYRPKEFQLVEAAQFYVHEKYGKAFRSLKKSMRKNPWAFNCCFKLIRMYLITDQNVLALHYCKKLEKSLTRMHAEHYPELVKAVHLCYAFAEYSLVIRYKRRANWFVKDCYRRIEDLLHDVEYELFYPELERAKNEMQFRFPVLNEQEGNGL